MNPTTLNRSFYPALDGLRGVAIILVLCRHNLSFIPYLDFGWAGVDLFFVLSGFLITDILLRTKKNKNFLSNFYVRRALKIFPLYYGTLLLFFLIAPLLNNMAVQYHYYHGYQAMVWLHLQNWLYIFYQKPANSLLLNHFWSLSVEEQFYLVWPFIILSIKNMKWLARVACGILAACIIARFLSWIYYGNGYVNFHFQYMTRVDGLCLGSLIAIWRICFSEHAKKKLFTLVFILLGLHLAVLILVKTALTRLPHFQFFGYSSIAAICSVMVYLAVEKRNALSKLMLENSFLKYTGKISYGLYVYHWPVLVLCKVYFTGTLVTNGYTHYASSIIVGLTALVIAIMISMASYHLFEKKILALKDIVTDAGFYTRAKKRLLLLLKPAIRLR